jgi:hypothetical protein
MSGNVAVFRRVLAHFLVFLLFLECLEMLLFVEGCCLIVFFYVLLFLECLEMLLFIEGFWLIFFGVFVIFRMSGNIAIFRRVLADFCACFCYF